MNELTLSEIWIYPIKSLGGIRLTTSRVMPKGLQHDRRWMLIDESGTFMTQRVYPQMALFKLEIQSDYFIITHKDQSRILPFNPAKTTQPEQAIIWDDTVSVFEVSEDFNRWFSAILGMRCKLVSFPEENARPVDPKYKVDDEHVSLADAYPFLIIGQSSLNDLNHRLETPVPMNRFRPNFVFTGGDAYEEDAWRNFTIGTSRFVGVKPCGRCVLTTVNQDTAEKGKEPLKTLASYRTKNSKVLFGQNLVALDHDQINVGDRINVESYE